MGKILYSVVLAFISIIYSGTFYSCMKIPKYQPPTTPVEYSFETGKDMETLFDFTANYVDANNMTVSEKITSLPWRKLIDAPTPFKANLEVEFTAKNGALEQESYEVGFKSEIKQPTATKSNSPISKAMSEDGKLRFTITLPQNISPTDLNLSVAPLKYNKHFAFTLTIDDSSVNSWSKIFPLVHRKWIDDIEFFHQGISTTTGYVPEHSLSMTDGCGNERRFGFGVAIWPTLGDDWHPNGRISEYSISKTNPYITWEELRVMLDFGCAVHYHNVNEVVYDKTNPLDILKGYELDYQKVIEKLGRKMKVLALPDGNKAYIEAAQSFPKIEFIRSSLSSGNLIYLHSCKGLKGVQTYGGKNTSDISSKTEELEKQSKSSNPYWVGLTVHRPTADYMQMLDNIYKSYGKAGSDNIWVASWDEIYEYQELRHGANISKHIDGQNVTFEISLPTLDSFDFHDISFILKGVDKDSRVRPVSENIYGFSQAYKDGELLINVNFNPQLLKLAEKYTAKYEKSSLVGRQR